MGTKNEKIPVEVFEVLPYDPATPTAPGGKLMRPTPMEYFEGRWARIATKRALKDQLEAAGHFVKSVNWAENPRRIVVYVTSNPTPPARPAPPPPAKPRRTAVSRLNHHPGEVHKKG